MSFSSGWKLLICIIPQGSCFPNTSVQLQSTQLAWPEHILLNTVSLDNSLVFNHCRVIATLLSVCLVLLQSEWKITSEPKGNPTNKEEEEANLGGKLRVMLREAAAMRILKFPPGSVRCDHRRAGAAVVLLSPGGVCVTVLPAYRCSWDGRQLP